MILLPHWTPPASKWCRTGPENPLRPSRHEIQDLLFTSGSAGRPVQRHREAGSGGAHAVRDPGAVHADPAGAQRAAYLAGARRRAGRGEAGSRAHPAAGQLDRLPGQGRGLGALAVGTAVATEREHNSINDALLRECCRYGLNYDRVVESYRGVVSGKAGDQRLGRAWWDFLIVAVAVGVFVYLGVNATVPALGMDFTWLNVLVAVLVAAALVGGWGLWKVTRFS